MSNDITTETFTFIVTTALLEEWGACSEGRQEFEFLFPRGAMFPDDVERALKVLDAEDLEWLVEVPECPRALKRSLALRRPRLAYLYARSYGGDDELREVACADPYTAADYAHIVDKKAHPLTRAAALRNSFTARIYAEGVGGDDELREATSRRPGSAFLYADIVDNEAHPVTRAGASKHPYWKAAYVERFGK